MAGGMSCLMVPAGTARVSTGYPAIRRPPPPPLLSCLRVTIAISLLTGREKQP